MIIPTPLGGLKAAFDAEGNLTGLVFLKQGEAAAEGDDPPAPSSAAKNMAKSLVEQLDAYFAGRLRAFSLPIAPRGTPFQLRVWERLMAIPYGSTTTYGQIAKDLGKPGLSRAVGRANGANPIWLIIPCHRVIGADGSLTGYAGGLERKARLLELEGLIPFR